MKHTKGEWKFGKNSGQIYSAHNGRHIATMNLSGMDNAPEWCKVDAALICAAPELLEALKLCARVLQDEKVDDGYRNTALTSAFSAVRKAEGK